MYTVLAIILIAAIAFGFFNRGPKLQTMDGTVYAIDGDTLVWNDDRVRLYGLDTPEKGQRGGNAATTALRNGISHGNLTLKPIERDVYGRLVARVFVGKIDVGGELVSQGYAIADKYSKIYRNREIDARRNKRGLWAMGGIEDPAAHRARHQ